MTDFITDDGRTHVQSMLMKESLQDREVAARTHSEREFEIFPDAVMVSIGGQSIFDRGAEALLPVVEEIAEAKKKHKMIVGVGGGTRVRHTCALAVDLGLPTGGVAQLVGAMEECNAVFLNALLARHGSIPLQREHFWDLPLYFKTGLLPIAISVPPYHFWEPPNHDGPIPAHGSDFGPFMHAEVLGMERVIYVKDEDGLYDKDPKRHADAVLRPRVTLDELLSDMPDESILDKQLFRAWKDARHVERVQIVNGLVPGQLLRALDGEDVGTVITRERA
jgi:molybdenum storage protein